MATIGDRIKAQRLQVGLTLKEVADAINVQEATVQRYESGVIKNIPYIRLSKLAQVLSTSVQYLIEGDEPILITSQIGLRIRNAREKLDMGQEELGLLCGVTKQTIFKYEKGIIKDIPLDRLRRIAKVLTIPIQSLIDEIPEASRTMADEKRLIAADDISNGIALYLAENAYLNDTAQGALEMVAKWVQNAPTVDAVPVIYCKDCARRKKGYCTIRKDSWGATLLVGDHDFCSDAERRKDG